MIVYCRNLSPFGRRVMLWLALQGVSYRQEPLQPVDHADRLARVNPALRVPVLELPDGQSLVDSAMIVDHLETVAPPEKRLIPQEPTARLQVTQTMAHALAATEKAVALVYEKNRRPEELHHHTWLARIEGQIAGALSVLESRLPAVGYVGGARPNGADVTAVIAYDFIETTNPHLLAPGFPRLAALSEAANATAPFADTHPKKT